MTQAYNLSQLANNLNTAGQLDATDGLVNAVPVENGGTGASDEAAARANLNVPGRDGSDASGTWDINITGNAATASSAVTASELNTANWTVEQQGTNLFFLYNGTRVVKISTSGAITAISDVQAGGTV